MANATEECDVGLPLSRGGRLVGGKAEAENHHVSFFLCLKVCYYYYVFIIIIIITIILYFTIVNIVIVNIFSPTKCLFLLLFQKCLFFPTVWNFHVCFASDEPCVLSKLFMLFQSSWYVVSTMIHVHLSVKQYFSPAGGFWKPLITYPANVESTGRDGGCEVHRCIRLSLGMLRWRYVRWAEEVFSSLSSVMQSRPSWEFLLWLVVWCLLFEFVGLVERWDIFGVFRGYIAWPCGEEALWVGLYILPGAYTARVFGFQVEVLSLFGADVMGGELTQIAFGRSYKTTPWTLENHQFYQENDP